MKLIYEPKGRAGEYAELAANLFTGCTNGCTYCYVPGMLRIPREKFHSEVTIKSNALERLEADLKQMDAKNDRRQVLMSFTSDVFQNAMTCEVTHAAMALFHEYDIPFTTLTKSPYITTCNEMLEMYRKCDTFGISLTYAQTKNNEPQTNAPYVRLDCLEFIHQRNIKTWVSFEPLINNYCFNSNLIFSDKYADEIRIGAGLPGSHLSYKDIVRIVNIRKSGSKDYPTVYYKEEFKKRLEREATND